MGAALLVAVALAVAAFSPFFTKRLDTFTFGVEAAGARPYLVKAGLNMFADHPLTGVGAGGYQSSFENDYFQYKDPKIKANVTISHTSLVTMMAELGVDRPRRARVSRRAVGRLPARADRRRAAGDEGGAPRRSRSSSAIIFLGSQTEGRFLEDPYLWLAAGLAVAIDGIMRARVARR